MLVFFALYMMVFTNQLLCFCRVSKIGHVCFQEPFRKDLEKSLVFAALRCQVSVAKRSIFFFSFRVKVSAPVVNHSFSSPSAIGYHLKIYENAIGSIKIMAVPSVAACGFCASHFLCVFETLAQQTEFYGIII